MASLSSTIPSTSLPSSSYSPPPTQSRVLETSAMILSWLRSAVPSILSAAGHKPRRAKREHPIDALTAILSDAVVLADFVSFLDPIRLPPSAVMRASSRNAMSSPLPAPGRPNIDGRQLQVQYKNNTRHVVSAVKRILVDVRAFLNSPHAPPPAAVDVFVGDVAALSPARDIRPAIKLAQLVIACAVYGPRHNEFRHCRWQFSTDPIRAAFHYSMMSVSQAVALPPPDLLYQPSPIPVISSMLSPQLMSPRPPLTPLPITPLPLSPHMLPHHIITPQINMHPRVAATPPLRMLSPPQQYISPPAMPPIMQPSVNPMSPGIRSPGIRSPRNPPVYPKPIVAMSPRATLTSSSSRSTPRNRPGRDSPRPPRAKKKPSVSRKKTSKPILKAAAVGTAATVGAAATAAAAALVIDRTMGDRKLSMVTDDESKSGKNTPPKPPSTKVEKLGSFKKVKSYGAPVREDVDQTDLKHFDSGITMGSDRGLSRSSEEFYTPDDRSPQSEKVEKQVKPQTHQFSESKVDANVRQSVTSSVARQISHPDNFGMMPADDSADDSSAARAPAAVAPKLFRGDSSSSIEFNDPRYMFSPSVSGAPSPSNQWQILRPKVSADNIHSPQQLFSPPQMPARLSRTTAGTQVTPLVAPPLFRQAPSPSLSISSAGAYSLTDSERLSVKKGSSYGPLASPASRASRSQTDDNDSLRGSRLSSSSRRKGFSLPPSAATKEAHQSPKPQREVENRAVAPVVYAKQETTAVERQVPETVGPSISDDSFSERIPFRQVQEEFVYNSDEQDYADAKQGEKEFLSEQADESVHEEVQSVHEDNGESEREDDETHDEREYVSASPRSTTVEEEAQKASSVEEESQGEDDEPSRNLRSPSPRRATPRPPSPGSTSGYYSTFKREVPPTPPTPPSIDTLVRRVSGHTPKPVDSRPVSTMEPSAQLFQKLMSVWQASEDDRQSNFSDARSTRQEMPTKETRETRETSSELQASQLTQESAAPSRGFDTRALQTEESMMSPRGRRPRALRIPSDVASPQVVPDIRSPLLDLDEKTSSFSDAISEEKGWEAAMDGDNSAGIPMPSKENPADLPSRTPLSRTPIPDLKKTQRTHSTTTRENGMSTDGKHIQVDPRRLDWLTRQLIVARNSNSRKDLRLAFAETEKMEKEEVLILEKEDAESVVVGMKQILHEREAELQEARTRLSMAIEGVARDRSSQESKTSAGGQGQDLGSLIREHHEKLNARMEESDVDRKEGSEALSSEMRGLWSEVKKAMIERMIEMTEKRDAELALLRTELENRERIVRELQKSSADLMNQNREIQTEASNMRVEKEKASHHYELELSHVTAQVELVNEFSKKLHDNFRETENLRQQVLHYQDKLCTISSTSGVSQRQIKELREAVTRANDECARLRREADLANRRGMEAVRRAEELEQLRLKDDPGHSTGRYPDRQARTTESGSYRSHEPVRPAGQNRPGGSGVNARYHAARNRGAQSNPTPAQKAWLAIKDKIGGIVTGKDTSSSRRKGHGTRRDHSHSRGGTASQSSHSSRSRGSGRDAGRSRSNSARSRSSNGSVASGQSGQGSSRSGGRNGEEGINPFAQGTPYSGGEVGRIRAADFS